MRKKLGFYMGLMLVMSISGCTHAENISSTIVNGSSIMQDETVKEPDEGPVAPDQTSASETLSVSDKILGTEETTTDELQDMIKYELTIQDILIPEDECLRHTPFMTGSVESVMKYNPNLKRVKSEEHANYCFNYWKGDGIEYVTNSDDPDIYGLIISANYSLNCGLKIGMKESDLQKNFPVMEKYEKGNLREGHGQIVFVSNIMNDKLGPLQTTDYDCAYACDCSASEEEVEEYQIKVTTAYSVTAFIKDGEVCKMSL